MYSDIQLGEYLPTIPMVDCHPFVLIVRLHFRMVFVLGLPYRNYTTGEHEGVNSISELWNLFIANYGAGVPVKRDATRH